MKNLAEQFDRLFSGLRRAHGSYTISARNPKKGKVEGSAGTRAQPVTTDLWIDHLAGKQGLGIVPIRDDGTVLFGAIDVDDYKLDLEHLSERIIKLGLPLVLCTTKSGGAHLYLFLSEPVEAEFIRNILGYFCAELGVAGSEIFPKQNRLANEKDIGNWINMPYFHARKTNRFAIYNRKQLSPEEFIDKANESKVDYADLADFIPKDTEDFQEAPPCLATLSKRGFGEGSRNNALYDIGVYLKLRYADDWEQYFDQYNQTYMDPPLPHKEVAQVLKNVSKVKSFYRCEQPPICDACNKTVCKTKQFGIGSSENNDPGFLVDHVVQVKGEDVYWIVQLQGERIEVSTNELLNFRLFEMRVVEKLRILPKPMKNDAWKKFISPFIATAEVIEVPTEAGAKGTLAHYLELFCTSNVLTKEKEGLLRGKPLLYEDRIYFRLHDFKKYLDQQRVKNINDSKIWEFLRTDFDAKRHQFSIKSKCVSVWHIRPFDFQDSEFDVPKIDVDEF